jgi:hypothetical protein
LKLSSELGAEEMRMVEQLWLLGPGVKMCWRLGEQVEVQSYQGFEE